MEGCRLHIQRQRRGGTHIQRLPGWLLSQQSQLAAEEPAPDQSRVEVFAEEDEVGVPVRNMTALAYAEAKNASSASSVSPSDAIVVSIWGHIYSRLFTR